MTEKSEKVAIEGRFENRPLFYKVFDLTYTQCLLPVR